jgi:hypothetical protein
MSSAYIGEGIVEIDDFDPSAEQEYARSVTSYIPSDINQLIEADLTQLALK